MSPIVWVWIGVAAWFLWFTIDCRLWVRFVHRSHQLDHEGKWEELEALIRKELAACRPWIRLNIHFRSPGAREGMAALCLFQRGKIEESLRFAEIGVRKSQRKPRTHADLLRLQALALAGLLRYDECRDVIGRIRNTGETAIADHVESLLCLYQGRLDDALVLAERARRDPRADVARHISSLVHLHQGSYGSAIEVLLEPARDVTSLYRADQLSALERTRDGRSMLEGHRRTWAGVVEPLRYLLAGYVYLEQDNPTELRFTMEKAAEVMSGNPSLRVIEAELNACLCAMTGDGAGADGWLRKGADVLQTHPRRASAIDFHRYAGRACLMLGRKDAAVEALERSLQLADQPMEKHVGRYWLARAYEARGDRGKAAELDRLLREDGIASKWSKASPPAPSAPPPAS